MFFIVSKEVDSGYSLSQLIQPTQTNQSFRIFNKPVALMLLKLHFYNPLLFTTSNYSDETAMIGLKHQPLPAAGREDDIMINLANLQLTNTFENKQDVSNSM